MVGLKEPGNYFKNKIASYFKAPVFSFSELSEQVFESMNKIYGVPKTSIKMTEEMKVLLRTNLTELQPKTYMDWMSSKLIAEIFGKEENNCKKIHCVIPDVATEWEYKFLRDYLLITRRNNFGGFRKTNKMILIENEDLLGTYYNKDYDVFNNFEVDGVISSEDEDPESIVKGLVKKWKVKLEK